MKMSFKFAEMKNTAKKKLTSRKGFTLVELVIVIAIIGILSAAAVPRALQYVDKAKIASDVQAANAYESALEVLVASGDIKVTTGSALSASIYISNSDVAAPESAESLEIFSQYTDKMTVTNKSGTVSLNIHYKNINAIRDEKGYPIVPEEFARLFEENVKLSNLKYYHGIVIDFESKGVYGNGLIER